jgi:hypothetical protein
MASITTIGFWLVAAESRYARGTPGRYSRLKIGKSSLIFWTSNPTFVVGAMELRSFYPAVRQAQRQDFARLLLSGWRMLWDPMEHHKTRSGTIHPSVK